MRKKEIVFDPEKRKNFLSGFRKRKNERRARAKDQLERNIKEERKRIRNDLKNSMAHMKKTFQPLSIDPELEQKCLEKEYEDDEVEINVIELVGGKHYLNEDSDKESNASEAIGKESYIASIPGMEFNIGEEKEKETKSKSKEEHIALSDLGKIGNKKMLDKLKKKKALKEFKKSKVFKQKERIEKKKQQKVSRREKNVSKNGLSGSASGNKNKTRRFQRKHPTVRGKRK